MTRILLGAPAVLILSSCATGGSSATSPAAEAPVPLVQRVARAEGPRPSRKAIVRRILPQNVRVVVTEGKTAKRTASGVVIGAELTPKGSYSYVLTNAHAIDASGLLEPQLLVTTEQRGEVLEYPADPVAIGTVPDMDLALLRVRGVQLDAAELAADAELEPGEDVVVAASPYGKAISISGGMVSQVEWDPKSKQPRMLKTDASIGYGASGGGIFSLETGRLLAIVEGYRTAKVGFAVAEQRFSFDVPMPGETFAAPSAKVRTFLQTHGYGRLLEGAPRRPLGTETAQR